MSEKLIATVREIDGRIILDDSVAVALLAAENKHNCRHTMEAQRNWIEHCQRRIAEQGIIPSDLVIVLLNVDDPNGGPVADHLMPNIDWQAFRVKDEIPIVRTLFNRQDIHNLLLQLDPAVANELNSISDTAVVVIDYGVFAVFAA